MERSATTGQVPPKIQAALAATLSARIHANKYDNAAASAAQSCCGMRPVVALRSTTGYA
ncbi:MAG: hypothetical protein LBL39_06680 [Planctomycetaceae bacterium]|nr:hypothetical protein [Planctomycetaceae bacterium]